MKNRTLLHLLIGFCCAAFCQQLPEVQAQGNQRINGTAVGIGGRLGGRSRTFTLIVNAYTPAGQVRELNEALKRGGQDELLNVLSKLEAGRIQIGGGVGVTANAIIADRWGEGGMRLTVFYERNINFLDGRGRGQGTLIGAAKVKLKDGNTWEVEDFGTFPAKLMGLRSSGRVLPV
jgi:hypothetical protein